MKRNISLLLFMAVTTFLVGCNGKTIRTDAKTEIAELRGPSIKAVQSPYKEAMQCVSALPDTRNITIGVTSIVDATGKFNTGTENATGSFVSQGASHMMMSSLSNLGVQPIAMSDTYKQLLSWYVSLGLGGKFKIEQGLFMIDCAITALDINTMSDVAELKLFGLGPGTRAFRSHMRMDTRVTAIPRIGTKRRGGFVVANSSLDKQLVGVESKFGFDRIVGGGSATTFLSFNMGGSERERMQAVAGYMADYAATDMVLQLFEKNRVVHKVHKKHLKKCRVLLEESPTMAAKEKPNTKHAQTRM